MSIRKLLWVAGLCLPLCSAYSQEPAPAGPDAPAPGDVAESLSPSSAELVRLAQAGTSQEVLLAYVQDDTEAFNLNADQILYLRDIGVSPDVITAMLNRDSALRNQPPAYTYDQQAYPPTMPPPGPQPTPEPAPAPAPEPAPAAPPVAAPPVQPPAPVYVASPPPDVGYFYNDLSPYGTWVNLDGVGWCWQPTVTVINPAWQPYCDGGHWVFTDAGWFWQSDYSWGWAPFHYGRWYRHPRNGWVWEPDRVWGPAWVVWRSEGDACGWAPLPPRAVYEIGLGWMYNGVHVGLNFDFGLGAGCYTFVHLGDFARHDLGHRRMAPLEVTRIYNHTTIINNYQVRNRTFVNEGIRVDRVASATHTTIRAVPIRDVPAGSVRRLGNPGAGHTQVAVYRRQLSAPAKPVHMVAQRVDASHPTIVHQAPAANPARQPAAARNWTAPTRSTAPARGYYGTSASNQRQRASATPWMSAPPAQTERQNAYSAPRANSAARAPRSSQQSAWANPYRPEQSSGNYSERAAGNRQSQSVPRSWENNNFYEPKSYRQASQVRSLPPADTVRPTYRTERESEPQRGQPETPGRGQPGR